MSNITVNGSNLGTPLQSLLVCDEIVEGAEPSYQLCKIIYLYHVLGAKMVEAPINMAQSQAREIAVPSGPEDRLKKAFADEWKALAADKQIFNVMRLSRVYGIASAALMPEGSSDPKDAPHTEAPVDFWGLYKQPSLKFNIFDPLNTAGSLVLNQQPNDPDFLKVPNNVRVNGKTYHHTRIVVKLNEEPVYLGWTAASFGYVGRSVYQRALFSLKSFVQTQRTDDLISLKAGVLIAKMKAAGSIVTQAMKSMFGLKSEAVKQAQTYNVISISTEEGIESLNLQNLDGAYGMARTNILKNIATAADMPARLLENETMVSGFGEGTEDAKAIAAYVDRFRIEMQPIYDFFDEIVQYRAWNPDFYAAIKAEFPDDYGKVEYKDAFYRWRNSFAATWPSLITEPDSEKAKAADVKLKALLSTVEIVGPKLDPENNAALIEWFSNNMNEIKEMFSVPLNLDYETLASYQPPAVAEKEPDEPRPFAAQDAAGGRRIIELARA